MLEIVSAGSYWTWTSSFFAGMAFHFFLFFSYFLARNGGCNCKRDDDGDDSPPFRRYTFRYRNNMSQVMRLMEVLFLGKNFVLFGL